MQNSPIRPVPSDLPSRSLSPNYSPLPSVPRTSMPALLDPPKPFPILRSGLCSRPLIVFIIPCITASDVAHSAKSYLLPSAISMLGISKGPTPGRVTHPEYVKRRAS
ncbi:hypothetical protein GY45DRAFT_698916 [Cubamyces sp. BRFM 1775]|nr:hypothetical protein GY45DRAFT_698916 [Cubamyces sp. BRFM 1775]